MNSTTEGIDPGSSRARFSSSTTLWLAARAEPFVRCLPACLTVPSRSTYIARHNPLAFSFTGSRVRAVPADGEMSAGAANGRGFVLSTRLPLTGHKP